MKGIKTAVLVMVFAASAAAVYAGPKNCYAGGMEPGMGRGGDMGGDIVGLIDDLKLSPEQVKKLRDMRDADKREIIKTHTEIRLAMMDMQDEYKKEKPDMKKIDEAIDKISEFEKKIMKIRASHMLKTKEILTKEQFEKMMMNLDKGKEKMKKKFFNRLNDKK